MADVSKKEKNYYLDHDSIYASAERNANYYNLIFLAFLTVLCIIVIILNILGIFSASKMVVTPVCIVLFFIFLSPVVWFFIHDIVLKKEPSLLYWKKYKYFLVAVNFLGITIFSIYLSFHAILLLAVPSLMMAQYRYNKKDMEFILIMSVLLVPVGVYGSYLFGIPDRNLLKDMFQEAENAKFINRINLLTGKRAVELFLHYCLTRMLALSAINFLINGISKRNKEMLDKQADLARRVSVEMHRRNELQNNVIEQLASVIETRDVGTGEHIRRTKKYVAILVKRLAQKDEYKDILTPKTCENIIAAAPMHDIGKIVVSDLILLKPGRLTPEEFEQMKVHTEKGGEMVEVFFAQFDDIGFIQEAYDVAVSHHEKWDGTGYPKGLEGEEIPLAARIMAIADVFDALTSKRVYKDAMSADEAFKIIVEASGKHFDPTLVEVFIEAKDDFFKELGN